LVELPLLLPLLLLLLLLLLLQELAKGPKLVLRADDEAQLMAVADAARAQGLPCHSIAEATGGASGCNGKNGCCAPDERNIIPQCSAVRRGTAVRCGRQQQ
jgi:hypothetical protein